MPTAEVNGARLWYDETGEGDPLLLLHGGLADSELWEPVVPLLAGRFRALRMDFRFFGRSAGPAAPFSPVADVIGLVEELRLAPVALAGVSLGGRVAIDVALERPDLVRAVAAIAPALSGHDGAPYTAEQERAYDEAEAAGDLEAAMAVDFAVWAPLGVDERIRRLWLSTPDANPIPAGAGPLPPARPAKEHLDELSVPTLVVTVAHDPPGFREVGPLVARDAPAATHVELDSDHYVTLREPELVARTLLDFLG
jgi:pimeloyl-ACP methyl ester carboxylesterase